MEESFVSDTHGGLDKARLKALSQRSDAKGLVQLASHLGAIGLSSAAVLSLSGWWLVPALLVQGLLMTALFAPLHETIHRTAFRSRRLNDTVAWVCGAVLVLPPDYFRAFHFAHHRYTQDPAKDPELATPKPRTWRAYLTHVSGLPYWRVRIGTTLSHAAGRVTDPFIAPGQRRRITREARLLLLTYAVLASASLAAGSAALLWLWVVPMLLGQPALRLYLMAEHGGCPEIPDMLANTRTTRSNALVRWLAWNMPYHVEHHAYPALPFHALPAAHEVLKDRIKVLAPGYVAVHRELIGALEKPGTVNAAAR